MRSRWIFIILLMNVYAGGLEGVQSEPTVRYTFEEGPEDVSGNGFDGTLLGDAYVEYGYLVLDGDDDAVEIPRIHINGDSILHSLTYAMWIYPIDDLLPLEFSGGINTHDWNPGSVHFKVNYGLLNVGISGFGADVVGVSEIEFEMWSHIALTISDTEVILYLDGYVEATATVTDTLDLIVGNACIGAWNNGGSIEREMVGMMDDVRIYDRALSAEEIAILATPPSGISDKDSHIVPGTFDLSQNYPNPFNPTTTITYTLNVKGRVNLSVYDLLGREVAVLVNGNQSTGNHEVQFSGADLTSGVYFYKLQINDQVITQKMILVK